MCGCLGVQYKYNITLYNLIIKKQRGFIMMCVYCYHVIITFCYKVRKIVKLMWGLTASRGTIQVR